jgi:hypothetical protein
MPVAATASGMLYDSFSRFIDVLSPHTNESTSVLVAAGHSKYYGDRKLFKSNLPGLMWKSSKRHIRLKGIAHDGTWQLPNSLSNLDIRWHPDPDSCACGTEQQSWCEGVNSVEKARGAFGFRSFRSERFSKNAEIVGDRLCSSFQGCMPHLLPHGKFRRLAIGTRKAVLCSW